MDDSNHTAIDAIWKTSLKNSQEKLVLVHLTSKHNLNDQFSTSAKRIDKFLEDFSDKWCPIDELKSATRLSDVKLDRIINDLKGRGYLKLSEKQQKYARSKSTQTTLQQVCAITPKIFNDALGKS